MTGTSAWVTVAISTNGGGGEAVFDFSRQPMEPSKAVVARNNRILRFRCGVIGSWRGTRLGGDFYKRFNSTSMFPRVALEYGQVWWDSSISSRAVAYSIP